MNSDSEVYLVDHKVDRQKQIEALELGDTISIARRVDLTFGISPEVITEHRRQLRGVMDVQCYRARRKVTTAEFKVENGSFLTTDAAMMIVATVTRIN